MKAQNSALPCYSITRAQHNVLPCYSIFGAWLAHPKLTTQWYVPTFQEEKRKGRERFAKPTLPEALWYPPCALLLFKKSLWVEIHVLSWVHMWPIWHLWIMLTQPTSNNSQLSNKSNNHVHAWHFLWYKVVLHLFVGVYTILSSRVQNSVNTSKSVQDLLCV